MINDSELFEDESKDIAPQEVKPVATISIHKDNPLSILEEDLKNIEEVATALEKYDNEQSVARRNTVMNHLMTAFAAKRFNTNMKVESLKEKIIKRVEDNVDNLDLETAVRAITDLHMIASQDLGIAMGVPQKGTSNVQINLQQNNQHTENKPTVNVSAESLNSVSKINEALGIIKSSNPEILDVEVEEVSGDKNG